LAVDLANNGNYLPNRMCCVCRKTAPKTSMIRIVKYHNKISVDKTGRANGRGCHICPSCVEKAIKTKAINRSFKCSVDAAVYEELKNILNT
jgi:predicted RNA-binding protein YlxR (DUF448 family)